MNMQEFFHQPSQMEFWSRPKNLVAFLAIQADLWYAGASPMPSTVGEILEKAAKDIEKVYENET